MIAFYYHIQLNFTDNDFNVSIFISNDGFSIPIYIRSFDPNILNTKAYFSIAYDEFKEYLQKSRVVISRDNFLFLSKIIRKYGLLEPSFQSITFSDRHQFLVEDRNLLITKEITFLIYVEGMEINDKRIKDWEEENHLNTSYLIKILLEANYITKDDYEMNLFKANRQLLSSIVEEYNLDVIGNNKDLIKKIQTDLTKEQIKKHFSGTHYHLTEKGKELVKVNFKLDEFYKSHFHYVENMRLEEFHLLMLKKPEFNYQAICRLLFSNLNSFRENLIEFNEVMLKLDKFPGDTEITLDYIKKKIDIPEDVIEPNKTVSTIPKFVDHIKKKFDIPEDVIEPNKTVSTVPKYVDYTSKLRDENLNLDKSQLNSVEKTENNKSTIINSKKPENISLVNKPIVNEPKVLNVQNVKEFPKIDIDGNNDVVEIQLYIEENYKIKDSIDEYKKRKEFYLRQNEPKVSTNFENSEESKEDIQPLKSSRSLLFKTFAKCFLFVLFVIIVLLYLNYKNIISYIEIKNKCTQYIQAFLKWIKDLISTIF